VSAVRKIWRLHPHDDIRVRRLAIEAKVGEVIAALLVNRGLSNAAEARLFLDAPMAGLHSPALLPGIEAATDRLAQAIKNGEAICIYGDYDADGTTGTAILVALLQRLGGKVAFHIPHRIDDGYGLKEGTIRELAEAGTKLIVTVDCGITALDEAKLARDLGVDLIVTDHHEMKADLPDALAVVHPRAPGSQYPFPELSGSCVAFKLAWATAQKVQGAERVSPELRESLLDAMGIAAVGLVADVMPLRGENRIFTRHGLLRLGQRPSLGVQALLDVAKLTDKVRAEDVGYKIGPRINAAGRLGCARLVVELFTTANPRKARELAEFLEGQNTQRQTIERRITAEAKQIARDRGDADAPAIVLGSPDWHQGVVGIVAGKLAEHFGKPVLIASLPKGDPTGRCAGSGRTFGGFPLYDAIEDCAELFDSFGGHAAAAGFKMPADRLDELRRRFCEAVALRLPDGPATAYLLLDAEVPLSSLTLSLMKELDKLEPYGHGNPRPMFLASGLTVVGTPTPMGPDKRHLSCRLQQGTTHIRAVGWGMAERIEELMSAGGACSVAFTPKNNEWNGQRKVEMEIADIQAGPVPKLG